MSRYILNNVIGILLALVDLSILKITHPRAVSFHRTLRHLITNPRAIHVFDAEQFALVILDRYKGVFDRLADM